MTIRLPLRKRVKKLKANSKGFSSVIGTTFMVLVMMFLSTSVFLWTLSQNTVYNEAVRARNQEEANRRSENVVALSGNYSVSEVTEEVTVHVVLKNVGSVTAQIINLWVLDSDNRGYANKSLNLNMNPGDVLNLVGSSWLTVTIPEAKANHTFTSWFVTARGNTIPLEKEQGVIIAQVAQGIGSIAMDFGQFRCYEVPDNNDGTDIGSPRYDFTIDSNKYTLLCVALTNLDPSQKAINLTGNSYIWMITAHAETMKGDAWDIRKVQNNKLATFNFQILEYGKLTMVYFGATKPKWVRGVVPVFILLFGKLGTSDYGQNLPFIALRVT